MIDRRKKEMKDEINIKKLKLKTYHVSGISVQVLGFQRYNTILEKLWLYHANPNINWRANILTFQYGLYTINIKVNKTKAIDPECYSVFILRQ